MQRGSGGNVNSLLGVHVDDRKGGATGREHFCRKGRCASRPEVKRRCASLKTLLSDL